MHPRSALHASPPDFVVYQTLTDSKKRSYMSVLTAVDTSWLPKAGHSLASLSAPLPNPLPEYNARADDVLAWHRVKYGMHAWELPLFPGATSHLVTLLCLPCCNLACIHSTRNWSHLHSCFVVVCLLSHNCLPARIFKKLAIQVFNGCAPSTSSAWTPQIFWPKSQSESVALNT
jgi:hypothetical protein